MKTRKPFLIFYILITLSLLVDVMMVQKFKISLAGYWSDRVLFWFWAISTVAFLVVFWKNIFTKIYFGLIVLGFIISIIAMMLPFWAISRSDVAISADGKYRLQVVRTVMTRPALEIIENNGLLEKVIAKNDIEFQRNDRLKVGYETISEVKFVSETSDSLTFDVRTPWRSNLISFKKGGDEQ
ncbi:hypothetical protein ASE92_10665 [Pedobacter sp. Leaf41]|uniref:hypothetical protein n=1 Tax=Pedobacter sp. Leaf41 TaxID=1736218 RepID=UPI00070383F2|nr:hypothetical protein [Pedobacter sp. Leaf41]KQN35078.1 hypothetical protein ASE92_10665 [Pedobacter sp. Leaf41]